MRTKKFNILFISSWYPSRVEPFLGNFVQKHADAVALHSNVSALYVCSDPNLKGKTFELHTQTINNVFTVNVYYKKVTNKIPGLSQLQKFSRYLKAHKMGMDIVTGKKNKIDLIHLNVLWPAGLFVKKYAQQNNIPYIITEHSTSYLKARDQKKSAFELNASKKITANAELITPVSLDLKKAMLNFGLKGDYEVVNNVVDTTIFYPAKKKKEGQKFRFLHISTLIDEHKNISGMIRTAAELAKKNSDFEFKIIGDGNTSPHIEQAKKLGVLNSIIFIEGKKTTEEVAEEMRNADCFMLFSNYENMPVVIIEAFASGIPVLSSNVGGIFEHLHENRGILVGSKNEKELIAAMEKMIKEARTNKFNKTALHQYAIENFSYEKVGEHFHEIYLKILEKQ